MLSNNSFRFILEDITFEDGSEGNITMVPLNKQKKKDPNRYDYFFNLTAETTPQLRQIVQTKYLDPEIGE